MAFTPPQQFCVRWNSYQSNLQNVFPKLLISEHFVDVTLACENEMLKCHKIVLSACSTYFEKLLLQNPCQHPIIFMKDMKIQEMQLLVEFMYKGEVNVTQDDLPSLLRSAEALQIRGLCGSDHLLSNQNFVKTQLAKASAAVAVSTQSNTCTSFINDAEKPNSSKDIESTLKNGKIDDIESMTNHSSSDSDSNDGFQVKDEGGDVVKEEVEAEESYYEGETEMLDTEFVEGEGSVNIGEDEKPQILSAIANVSCHYDGSAGSVTKRIRRTDEELRRAAECITRGQTFQNVSDQFSIPISTIRFYMARKGILPRRKRGRSCSGSLHMSLPNMATNTSYSPSTPSYSNASSYNSPGNTSPIGPPYHIVHYKLPQLGMSKLK